MNASATPVVHVAADTDASDPRTVDTLPTDAPSSADDALPLADIPVDEPSTTVAGPDGRQVAYAEYGDEDGTPLLFLHGTPGSRLLGALFDRTARRRGVRVLAPDRPGYGRSTPWTGRSLSDAGRCLTAVLDDAGVDRTGVVGFSGGGPHALALAATHEERVTRVDVVAGAVPPSMQSTTPPVQRLLGVAATRTPRLLGAMLRGQRWVAERGPASAVTAQYVSGGRTVPDGVAELVRLDFVEALGRSRRGAVTESRLLAQPWRFDLNRVTRPVRLWHGDRDTNVPVDGARALASALPDARLTVFDDVDHLTALRLSRPEVVEHSRQVGSPPTTASRRSPRCRPRHRSGANWRRRW